jgi:hypothetical protein
MRNITIKLFSTIFLCLFIFSVINAQKVETETNSRTESDFTTTPFQDGNQAKGSFIKLEAFQMVENGEFEEGNIKIKIPTFFKPQKESFTIEGDAVILKMMVYNMLGELVYEGKMNASWQDKNAQAGLYIYALHTRILPNKTTKIKGFIKVEN